MIVFAFDRDLTVDTSEGPIPLSTIISLAKHFPAYAIGNQQLVLEANIPGRESLGPDKVYLSNAVVEQNIGGKHLRLQKLLKLYPTFTRICTDDYNISFKGWHYFTPYDFHRIFTPFAEKLK